MTEEAPLSLDLVMRELIKLETTDAIPIIVEGFLHSDTLCEDYESEAENFATQQQFIIYKYYTPWMDVMHIQIIYQAQHQ